MIDWIENAKNRNRSFINLGFTNGWNKDTYDKFNELLNQYVRNTNEDKIFEKAHQLKASIMTFIAEKMNNGK